MRTTVVVCDLDQSTPARTAVAEIQLVVDRARKSLDVCQEHLEFLRALSPPGDKPSGGGKGRRRAAPARGARTGAAGASRRRTVTTPAGDAEGSPDADAASRGDRQLRLADVREWARAQGREVADRGRLPAGLVADYEAATAS